MKLSRKGLRWTVPALAIVTSAACAKKKDDSAPAAAAPANLASLTNPAQLGVSSALTIAVPDAYSGKATALNLAGGKKSQEACQMGQPIQEVIGALKSVSSFFCHIEVEKDTIKFGVKTIVSQGGVEFGRIWIDNSKVADGKITLYMCKEGSLQEKIDITGVILGADGKPSGMKGTVDQMGSEGTHTYGRSVVFDKDFTGDYLEVTNKDKFTDSATNGSFARSVALKLQNVDTNISSVSLSSKGTWGGQEFQQRGLGLGASGFGQAMFTNSGTHNNQTFSWTRRSHFDDNGYVVTEDASSLLAEGGALRVDAANMPAYLAADFALTAPTGWDCSGAEVTVDIDVESAAHAACEKDRDDTQTNCWGDDFEGSTHVD